VDDEHFNIEALTFIIRKFGFDIHVAYNGKEALTKFQTKIDNKCGDNCSLFKVILMDINMPIMSGWDAVKQIRNM
jgi:CheY-like chemotaxis protein